ncbi:MAG: histidine phosphatase family protein [Pseudomonadota bacterium]
MKRIVLIRHAKSSWADDAQDDLDRPLNQRGRIAAPIIGTWLADHKLKPDFTWLSPATRCQETWERVSVEFGKKPEVQTHRALYMADPKTTLEIIKLSDDEADTVAVVGHQPGIGATTRKLADGKESETLSRAYRKFPTAGVAVLEADIKSWDKLKFGEAKFKHFVMPKELI